MEQTFDLTDLAAHYHDAESARLFLEAMRWPNGPVCPHCNSVEAYKLTAKEGSKKPVREGVYKCKGCRKQFTVTVGTLFEDSHIPLNKWLLAFHLLCASKKGMSAHQLHRLLHVTYRSAWFMAHRIRFAMSQPPLAALIAQKLKGTVEADETYVGGKQRKMRGRETAFSNKMPVFTLVERDGRARSFHVKRVTADNLMSVMKENIEKNSHVVTDDFASYMHVKNIWPMHSVIRHTEGVYSKMGPWGKVHTNTVEGFFGILKRGIYGTYHHIGEQHLTRYLAEFDFRYNSRKMKDGQRTLLALQGIEGKRLTLKEPSANPA
jgi:transposase-like protein